MTSSERTLAHELDGHGSIGRDVREYAFTLFVSGASHASSHAIADVRELCDVHLRGRYELSILDLNQQPASAAHHRVLATPTLARDRPLPSRIVVGDMSDHRRILAALDVDPRAKEPSVHHADPSCREGAP